MKLNPLVPRKITAFVRRTLHLHDQVIYLVGAVTPELFWQLQDSLNTNRFLQSTSESLPQGNVNTLFYLPPRYTANSVIFNQIVDLKKTMRTNGQFHMVTTKSTGGLQFYKMVVEIFGEENCSMEVGSGGLRLVSAIKKDDSVPQPKSTVHKVSFEILGQKLELETHTSTFSQSELDTGAKALLLATEKDIKKAKYILDLGCGWGPIGLVAALVNPKAEVTMLDVNPRAIKATKANRDKLVLSERVKVFQNNTPSKSPHQFDLVLTNPPFHNTDESLSKLFSDTKAMMTPNGVLFASIEKTYIKKFEKILASVFGKFEVVQPFRDNFIVLKAFLD